MFFGNFAILEFLFNKVAGLKACSFIKKRLQRRCFLVKSAKDHPFYRTLPVAASGNIWWTLSLLHMRMMNRVTAWYVLALQCFFRFIAFFLFLSISFFFFLFFCGFYYLLRYWGKFVNTWKKQWSFKG